MFVCTKALPILRDNNGMMAVNSLVFVKMVLQEFTDVTPGMINIKWALQLFFYDCLIVWISINLLNFN